MNSGNANLNVDKMSDCQNTWIPQAGETGLSVMEAPIEKVFGIPFYKPMEKWMGLGVDYSGDMNFSGGADEELAIREFYAHDLLCISRRSSWLASRQLAIKKYAERYSDEYDSQKDSIDFFHDCGIVDAGHLTGWGFNPYTKFGPNDSCGCNGECIPAAARCYSAIDDTNVFFNYRICLELAESSFRDMLRNYQGYWDGDAVEMRYGHFSPAYAVALFYSFEQHSLENMVLQDYETFSRFHPRDRYWKLSEFDKKWFLDLQKNRDNQKRKTLYGKT